MREVLLRGKTFYIHDGEDISNAIIRDNDYYEDHILDYLCERFPSHKVILDIGAMIGNHTSYFARFLQHDQIIAFEPMPEHFQLLSKNTKEYSSVILYNQAVSNVCGKVLMERHSFNWGMHGVKYSGDAEKFWDKWKYTEQEEIVECVTLDSLNLQNITLMKIDVEMHEPQVFEGAKNTIEQNKPLILIEDCYKQYESILHEFGYVKIMEWPKDMTYIYKWGTV